MLLSTVADGMPIAILIFLIYVTNSSIWGRVSDRLGQTFGESSHCPMAAGRKAQSEIALAAKYIVT
jgi:hypothetical protein